MTDELSPGAPRLDGGTVLLVEVDGFLADYYRRVIEAAGGTVVALPSCEAAARRLAGPDPLPTIICIDAGVAHGWAPALLNELRRSGIPCRLVEAPSGWDEGDAVLRRPFAGFQLVERLAEMMARS